MSTEFPIPSVLRCLVLIIGIALATSCNRSKPSPQIPAETQEKPLIRFDTNGKLKIVQFADLHYGEAPDTDWGPAADIKSTKVINNILQWEEPDFIILTGDQVTGELMYPNATDYVRLLLKPLVEKRYRWASIYGNHDIGPNLTRLEILAVEQSYGELCYTERMVPDLPGVTNYFLPIYTSENRTGEDKPVMIWWFFDSQGGRSQYGQQPHYIDSTVVDWFRIESQRLRVEWGQLPSLVFFHIPPQEYVAVQESVVSNHLCTGLLDDDVTAQDNNTGIMAALEEVGGVKTIFVGHDHGNAWCCYYKDIMEVCYNRHTGYGGYGVWTRGARVIELDLVNLMNQTNYVRLETGEIVDRFSRKE